MLEAKGMTKHYGLMSLNRPKSRGLGFWPNWPGASRLTYDTPHLDIWQARHDRNELVIPPTLNTGI